MNFYPGITGADLGFLTRKSNADGVCLARGVRRHASLKKC